LRVSLVKPGAYLSESYAESLIDKSEFEPRITRLRQRLTRLEEQRQALADEAALQGELQLIIGRLEDFATKLHDGLEAADWAGKRDLIRALVKRVEVARNEVNVVFRIDPYPSDNDPEKKSLQLCRGRSKSSAGQHIPPYSGYVYGIQISKPLRMGTTKTETAKKSQLPLRQICRWHAGTGVKHIG